MPRELLEAVVEVLSNWSLPVTRVEMELHEAIHHVLSEEGIGFIREAHLGTKGRVDFLVDGGVAIEVKVDGQWSSIVAQLHRYASHEDVTAVLLVTTRRKHQLVDCEEMCGKPVMILVVETEL